MSRAKNGKRATASPPPTGRRGRARAGTPASELGEPTKSRRSRRKRRKSPIVEEDEEDEEEILSVSPPDCATADRTSSVTS